MKIKLEETTKFTNKYNKLGDRIIMLENKIRIIESLNQNKNKTYEEELAELDNDEEEFEDQVGDVEIDEDEEFINSWDV